MKAKVESTGKVIEVREVEIVNLRGGTTYRYRDVSSNRLYESHELRFIDDDLDYWTRFEHQAAIAAMQGLLQSPHLNVVQEEPLVGMASSIAHALVERYKKE